MILPIIATAALTLVLYLTGVFVVFTPLPILFTFCKKGAGTAAGATVLSLVVLTLLYRVPGPLGFLPMMVFYPDLGLTAISGLSLLYFSYYLLAGWVVAYASRRSWPNREATFAGMTAVILALPALALFLATKAMGVDLLRGLSNALNGIFQKMLDLQNGAGLSTEDFAYLREYAPVLVSRMIEILPALWIDLTLLVLGLNLLFLRRWIGGKERPFRSWSDFSIWRLEERWIWVPIATGALFFINIYLLKIELVGVVLTNLLIVAGAAYFFQGLAIVSFFIRGRLSPLARLLVYIAGFLFLQVAGVMVIAVGLFDFWFDFRKPKKVV